MGVLTFLAFILGASIPLILLLGSAVCFTSASEKLWRRAHLAGFMALITSILLSAVSLYNGAAGAFYDLVFITPVSVIVLLAITLIGFVVLRFSENYMSGEANQHKFAGLLQLTFAASTLVIISNHLLMLMAAWMTVSLAMHQLLLFYPERPRAALAAHKKFIFARLAEISLLAAFMLLYFQNNTWVISELMAHYGSVQVPLNTQEHLAAGLIALAVIIKSAQLPGHGWLIQVVEAPTPVSAALHGGVINMGGVILISFAPLFGLSVAAQWLVLVVAGLSMLIAALVMTTRVSIKVRLAWSTSAQMSLMLIECALGLYELALLHLVAHSFYKAHAFLNSGNAVNQNIVARSAIETPPQLSDWIYASVFAVSIVAGVAYLASQLIPFNWHLSPWLLLTFALIMLLAQRTSSHHSFNLFSCVLLAVLVSALYVGLKSTSQLFIGASQHIYNIWADAWISIVFISLFLGGYLQRYQLHRSWVQKMNLALFSGLYIDEWSTRITLAIWPKLLPVRMNAKELNSFKKESLS